VLNNLTKMIAMEQSEIRAIENTVLELRKVRARFEVLWREKISNKRMQTQTQKRKLDIRNALRCQVNQTSDLDSLQPLVVNRSSLEPMKSPSGNRPTHSSKPQRGFSPNRQSQSLVRQQDSVQRLQS